MIDNVRIDKVFKSRKLFLILIKKIRKASEQLAKRIHAQHGVLFRTFREELNLMGISQKRFLERQFLSQSKQTSDIRPDKQK